MTSKNPVLSDFNGLVKRPISSMWVEAWEWLSSMDRMALISATSGPKLGGHSLRRTRPSGGSERSPDLAGRAAALELIADHPAYRRPPGTPGRPGWGARHASTDRPRASRGSPLLKILGLDLQKNLAEISAALIASGHHYAYVLPRGN